MKIGILGSGNIGGTLGRHLAKAGQTVFFSSRHPEKLQELAEEVGNGAEAGTPEDAAKFGEMLVLAIPWRNKEALPNPDLFMGKVVIDTMNPYSAFGRVMDLGESTSSEEVAKVLPGARLVKAFNTMSSGDLKSGAFKSGADRWAIFVAGDDADAKRIVSGLVAGIGFVPIDTGSLREGGRLQQPGSPIYAKRLTEYPARMLLQSPKG
ncbi:MAG: NADPH-dependent F420 reductase [Thaumarchaeota archaeon]|nr:NADPH-dependent F420 reductase [Nitrososphaerota archaeon]